MFPLITCYNIPMRVILFFPFFIDSHRRLLISYYILPISLFQKKRLEVVSIPLFIFRYNESKNF